MLLGKYVVLTDTGGTGQIIGKTQFLPEAKQEDWFYFLPDSESLESPESGQWVRESAVQEL